MADIGSKPISAANLKAVLNNKTVGIGAAADAANTAAEAANAAAADIKARADAGEFNGKDGETGPQGPQGEKGADGVIGKDGAAAGFGTLSATVSNTTGTPSCAVSTSGDNTALNILFAFEGIKGEQGDAAEYDPSQTAELEGRLQVVWDALFTEVTSNPWVLTFSTTDGATIEEGIIDTTAGMVYC
jgi:hypothetical protein